MFYLEFKRLFSRNIGLFFFLGTGFSVCMSVCTCLQTFNLAFSFQSVEGTVFVFLYIFLWSGTEVTSTLTTLTISILGLPLLPMAGVWGTTCFTSVYCFCWAFLYFLTYTHLSSNTTTVFLAFLYIY